MTSIQESLPRGVAALDQAMAGITAIPGYDETAYHLPISYAVTGTVVEDAASAQEAYQKSGKNPLIAWECLQASMHQPLDQPYTGFIADAVIRKLGYSLVDGSILGLALIVGTPQGGDLAAAIARELQEKYMLTFLAGDVVSSLSGAGVKVGLDYRLIPLGPSVSYGIHFADLVARVAMIFGGVAPGDAGRLLAYAKERAKAVVFAFPGMTDQEIACIDALRILGIPIIGLGGYEGGEWIAPTPTEAVRQGMDLLGIRVTVTAIPIPMACSPAFEGKSIRKEEMYAEFGGGRSPAFELLRVRPEAEVVDGKVTVIGPEIEAIPEGSAAPLGIVIEVAGRTMKKEYEPVLERRIHNFVNYGEGSWHVAQRDLIWVRLSKEAVKNGVRVEHIGKLLTSKFRIDFPDLLDAVQVTLITDPELVLKVKMEAEAVYDERDARIKGMKDDDVDTYYSCTLCQTFAPDHVCIITPERPGLCGAISWLDGKIAFEISPAGANQPVRKEGLISKENGEFEGVNRFVRKTSHGAIERCQLYNFMEYPMTACGCFEVIALVLPEVNGFMVVNREFKGETPSGMSFSTLAGTIGGGVQTPGFAGISKSYILSDRFLQAEGGIGRLVWMPSVLKEELASRLKEKLAASGKGDLFEKIADERNAETIEALTEFLAGVDHPALTMDPIL